MQRQARCSFLVSLQPLVITLQKIVAFGDSVTAGEDGRRLHIRVGFVDPVRSYPAVLQSRFAADFPTQTITVVNEGAGGEFAADGVRRLRDEVLPRHQPEVLLLLHGYNDLLNHGVAAVNEVVSALRTDVRTARSRGVGHVFVSTLTPSRLATGPANRSIDPRAIQETNAKLMEMAAEEGAILVPTYDAFAGRELELVGDDGLHLTFVGNEVLAATFYAAIRDTLLTTMPGSFPPGSHRTHP
jgi:lysophospholipase L1-like esterase